MDVRLHDDGGDTAQKEAPESVVEQPAPAPMSPLIAKFKRVLSVVFSHARRHVGVGVICSVAYFDPGNWGVDLEAGSKFGTRLLFVVLLSGLFAVLLQILAARLGCVTGLDLATHCRLLVLNGKHQRLRRWLLLYPLYALSEIAIIATDLAELLGSAIALCLIFRRLPLWAGVFITAFDVIVILSFGDPLRSRPLRFFEVMIAIMVISVFTFLIVIIARLRFDWKDALSGFLPSKHTFQSDSIYISIGILGATVMPHSLFLGSALATQDRLSTAPIKREPTKDVSSDVAEATTAPSRVQQFWSMFRNSLQQVDVKEKPQRYSDHENNPLSFINAHLHHGIMDIAGSLLGFAVLINSMILIIASVVFSKRHLSAKDAANSASLFGAHALIRRLIGKPAAFLFALALLCAGQSASFVATIAGQSVCEGFLNWRMSPALRRLLTRSLSLIPAMVVAIVVGKPGINALLVLSQVILSIVLPFIILPLIYCTSSKSIMRVKKVAESVDHAGLPLPLSPASLSSPSPGQDVEDAVEYVDFSNGKIVTTVALLIWLLICIANMYVIVMFILGKD